MIASKHNIHAHAGLKFGYTRLTESDLDERHHVVLRDDLPELLGVAGQVGHLRRHLEHLQRRRALLQAQAGVRRREPECKWSSLPKKSWKMSPSENWIYRDRN